MNGVDNIQLTIDLRREREQLVIMEECKYDDGKIYGLKLRRKTDTKGYEPYTFSLQDLWQIDGNKFHLARNLISRGYDTRNGTDIEIHKFKEWMEGNYII